MLQWFWLVVLAFALAVYLALDGFDLGVGILSGLIGDAELRDEMVASISPVWDGNGTWLVTAGTILFGAFPPVFAILLSALYIPLAGMLAGLILRGVALEFRHKAERSRWIWDLLLCAGSLLATFMQGVAVGAYAQGLPVTKMHFSGTGMEWCSSFPLWCGVGLVLGYMLLGAGWLVLKGYGRLSAFGHAAVQALVPMVVLITASILVITLMTQPEIGTRWFSNPILLVLPALGLLSFGGAWVTSRHSAALHPYVFSVLGCVLILLMLVASCLPYVVPFALTLSEAAAPPASQSFMFWGIGLFVLPMVVGYTWVSYSVFRGKVSRDQAYH